MPGVANEDGAACETAMEEGEPLCATDQIHKMYGIFLGDGG